MKNKLLLAVGSMALLTACDASKGNEMAWFDHAVKHRDISCSIWQNN